MQKIPKNGTCSSQYHHIIILWYRKIIFILNVSTVFQSTCLFHKCFLDYLCMNPLHEGLIASGKCRNIYETRVSELWCFIKQFSTSAAKSLLCTFQQNGEGSFSIFGSCSFINRTEKYMFLTPSIWCFEIFMVTRYFWPEHLNTNQFGSFACHVGWTFHLIHVIFGPSVFFFFNYYL